MELTEIITLIGTIGYILTIIATMTPNKTDDKIIQMILDVINKVAMNIGKAKNEVDK